MRKGRSNYIHSPTAGKGPCSLTDSCLSKSFLPRRRDFKGVNRILVGVQNLSYSLNCVANTAGGSAYPLLALSSSCWTQNCSEFPIYTPHACPCHLLRYCWRTSRHSCTCKVMGLPKPGGARGNVLTAVLPRYKPVTGLCGFPITWPMHSFIRAWRL